MYRRLLKRFNDQEHSILKEEKRVEEALVVVKQELNLVQTERTHLEYLLKKALGDSSLTTETKVDNDNTLHPNKDLDDSSAINSQSIDLGLLDDLITDVNNLDAESEDEVELVIPTQSY
uniref:Putative product n=1 Tax=Xenopsylla cheopis TaxID=163159 RepID=A0A6M2DE57_XENCH